MQLLTYSALQPTHWPLLETKKTHFFLFKLPYHRPPGPSFSIPTTLPWCICCNFLPNNYFTLSPLSADYLTSYFTSPSTSSLTLLRKLNQGEVTHLLPSILGLLSCFKWLMTWVPGLMLLLHVSPSMVIISANSLRLSHEFPSLLLFPNCCCQCPHHS